MTKLKHEDQENKKMRIAYELEHVKILSNGKKKRYTIMYMQKTTGSYLYVAPGYPYLTKHVHEGNLIAAGARKIKYPLWERAVKPISEIEPAYTIR